MEPLPPAAAHAFVDDLGSPALSAEDHHHLDRVLRLRDGQAVTVADGRGRWRLCTWRTGGALEAAGPVVDDLWPDPAVTVAFALTKGDRPEWVVQKLTELGVDNIVAFRAGRSVVRWDDAKAAAQAERWRRVAREAAMQSRRPWLPRVTEVVDFPEVVQSVARTGTLAAFGGDPPSLERPALLVGPEGGWTSEEAGCGLPATGLGPTVLRAETAATAGASLLCALRLGLVRPAIPAPNERHTA